MFFSDVGMNEWMMNPSMEENSSFGLLHRPIIAERSCLTLEYCDFNERPSMLRKKTMFAICQFYLRLIAGDRSWDAIGSKNSYYI